MWYEINVSLNGKHFFATHERSVVTKEKLIDVTKKFAECFKEEDGYELSIRRWETVGKEITHIRGDLNEQEEDT